MSPEGKQLRTFLQKLEQDPEKLDAEKVGELIATLDTAVGVLDLMNCETTLIVMTRMLGLKSPNPKSHHS